MIGGSEVMKIAVELTAINGISHVLGAVQRDMMAAMKATNATVAGFDAARVAAAGFAGIFTGGAILGGMFAIEEAGRRQLAIQQELLSSGLKQVEVNKIIAESWDLARTKGDFNSDAYLEMLDEARGSFRTTAQLIKAAPSLANFMTDVRVGDPHADPKGMIQDAIRIASIRGRLYHPGTTEMDEDGLRNELDSQGRVTRYTHGLLNPHTMVTNARQMGGIARSMSAEAYYGWQAELENTMGSSKAGTAMGSFATQLLAGTMTEKVAKHLMDIGVLHKDRVRFVKGHPVYGADAIEDVKGLEDNPFTYIARWLKAGAARDKVSEQEESYRFFGRQNGMRMGSDISANVGEYQNAFENQKKAWTAQQTADDARENNPEIVRNMLVSSWQDMVKSLGIPMVASVMELEKSLTGVFRRIFTFAQANPEAIGKIEKGIAAVSGLFIAGGTFLVMSAAFSAFASVMVPFAAAGAVGIAFVALTGPDGLAALGRGIGVVWDWTKRFVAWLSGQDWSTAPERLHDATKRFAAGAWDGMKETLLPEAPWATKSAADRRAADIGEQLQMNDLADQMGKPRPYPNVYGRPKSIGGAGSLSGGGQTVVVRQPINIKVADKTLGDYLVETMVNGWGASSDGMTGFDRRGSPVMPGSLVGAN